MSNQEDMRKNSDRFVAAYNAIDKKLRRRHGIGNLLGFSEMIRRCAPREFVVRKYQDALIDYARLRNAIVHGERDEAVAEPRADIVEGIERIGRLLCRPPRCLPAIARRGAVTIPADAPLAAAVFTLADCGHSHLPVLSGGKIVGILNGKTVTAAIARALRQNADIGAYLNSTKTAQALAPAHPRRYEILGKSAALDTAAALFEQNDKLKLILLTQDGTPAGKILGILTASDIVKFGNLLNE